MGVASLQVMGEGDGSGQHPGNGGRDQVCNVVWGGREGAVSRVRARVGGGEGGGEGRLACMVPSWLTQEQEERCSEEWPKIKRKLWL